jgi:hypothetical protein
MYQRFSVAGHLSDRATMNPSTPICVRTMLYEEKVSNFEIAVAKLKETLRNVKFATLCRSVA